MGTDVEVAGTAEERVAALRSEIADIEAAIASASSRKVAAQVRLSSLRGEFQSLRGERGAALAAGEDASGISKKLSKIREQIEAEEDAITALTPVVPDLEERRKELEKAAVAAKMDVNKAAFRVAAREYNAAAKEFAQVVGRLLSAREYVGEGSPGRTVACPAGWDTLAVGQVFIDTDGPPLNEVRHSDFYFIHARTFAADATKRRLAEAESRRAVESAVNTDG